MSKEVETEKMVIINKSRPNCFPTWESFMEWVRAARVVNEPVAICDDCLASFEANMGKRCDRKRWSVIKFAKPKTGDDAPSGQD